MTHLDLTLAGDAGEVAWARAALMDWIGDRLPVVVTRDAVLMTSELVTNAVLHAPGPTHLRASLDGVRLRVELHDGSAVHPVVKIHGPTSIGGHGMRLIADLATDWGCSVTAPGKCVWFETGR